MEELRAERTGRILHRQNLPEEPNWDSIQFDPQDFSSYTQMGEPLLSWVKACQQGCFAAEAESLRAKGKVRKRSSLLKLTPFQSDDGVLRVGGRIDAASLPFENRHPVILPAKHPLTSKIVTAFHNYFHHLSVDYVLSHIRQYYWILRERQVRRSCEICVKERARPSTQLMGELPRERLAAFKPAFTNTVVDYFGPFLMVGAKPRNPMELCSPV